MLNPLEMALSMLKGQGETPTQRAHGEVLDLQVAAVADLFADDVPTEYPKNIVRDSLLDGCGHWHRHVFQYMLACIAQADIFM